MIMVHNVSMVVASGDYHDMKKNAEILQEMNKALASAYVGKTGMEQDEILKLMDRETWLTANQAFEMGFVDAITDAEQPAMVANIFGLRLTDDVRQRVMAEKAAAEKLEAEKQELLKDLDKFGV